MDTSRFVTNLVQILIYKSGESGFKIYKSGIMDTSRFVNLSLDAFHLRNIEYTILNLYIIELK